MMLKKLHLFRNKYYIVVAILSILVLWMFSGIFTSKHHEELKHQQHNYYKIEKFTFVKHTPFMITEQLQSGKFIKFKTSYNITENGISRRTSLESVAGIQYKNYRRGHLCKGKKRRPYYRRGHYYSTKK